MRSRHTNRICFTNTARDDDVAISTKVYGGHFSACTAEVYCITCHKTIDK